MIEKILPGFCFCRKVFPLLLCTLSFVLLQGCNTTEPPNNGNLSLSVEDVSSTEAWLNLKTENISLPTNVTLLKNNYAVQTISLGSNDTIIYVDSLLPNKTYTFQTSGIGNQASGFKSNKVNVTTLDTTSNNFTWQTFTFGGDAGSSYLNDVTIINENNIWAVGAIYLKDSTGQPDPQPYNLAKWNGKEWNLQKVPYYYQGKPFFHPIQSVFAFDSNNVWLCGNGIIRWNGTKFIEVPVPSKVWGPFQMNKIWGISGNDLYIVGNAGNITHYQNGSWQKIESGTVLPFQDVWGGVSHNGEEQILAVASNKFSTGGKYLVRINGNNAIHLDDIITTAVSLSGIWFIPDRKYYLVGDGIYSKYNLPENHWHLDSITYKIQYYPYSINGNGLNDIAVCGEAGTIAHFNGVHWDIHSGEYLYDRLLSIKINNSLLVAVGTRYNNGINNNAIIYMGWR